MSNISDDNFVGTQADSLPDVEYDFSCKKGGSNPETVVDISQDDEWIRIPVSGVDEWVNKDGPSDITRTAKVQFPMEWGGVSIIQFINGFRSQNGFAQQNDPFDKCRIYFWDESPTSEDTWQIAHHGYVGGVGPSDNGTGKFWVYDLADLMKGIPVSESFNAPSLTTALEFAVRGTGKKGKVGIQHRSPWEYINYTVYGTTDIPARKKSSIQEQLPEPDEEVNYSDAVASYASQWAWESVINPLSSTIGDAIEDLQRKINNISLDNKKTFQVNRHNMVDYIEWVTSLLDARWWFEPFDDAPVLVVDASAIRSKGGENSYDRRYFVDKQSVEKWKETQIEARVSSLIENGGVDGDISSIDVFEVNGEKRLVVSKEQENGDILAETIEINENGIETIESELDDGEFIPDEYLPPHNYNIFEQVQTIDNNALVDMKPFNTLELYGKTTTYEERHRGFKFSVNYSESSSAAAYTEEYPKVTVQYEPLLKRANGYEYSTQPVETEHMYLDRAENAAIKEFRQHLAEATEGSITLKGEPYLLPFDYVVTMPVCNETYKNVDAEPIEWEVNGVHHKRHVGEQYTTELTVSIAIEDRLINVESEYDSA